jgi:eukaryotic-like serine/threonine-protein kinase
VLGALAIIIAILIVINSRADQQQQPPTVTDTGNPPASAPPPPPPPPSKTPNGSGARPGLRLDWPATPTIGNSGFRSGPARHGTAQ